MSNKQTDTFNETKQEAEFDKDPVAGADNDDDYMLNQGKLVCIICGKPKSGNEIK